ncbi:uncharacterized protein LOC143259998 [Megalopta genalis]|uniref:uncharacterized protein LOC143259998 n=1 Tax=Megalopta genalis TaxID=115081 RepID=UPI003FCEEEE6
MSLEPETPRRKWRRQEHERLLQLEDATMKREKELQKLQAVRKKWLKYRIRDELRSELVESEDIKKNTPSSETENMNAKKFEEDDLNLKQISENLRDENKTSNNEDERTDGKRDPKRLRL